MKIIKRVLSLLLSTMILAGSTLSASASTAQSTKSKAVFAPVSSNQKMALVSSTKISYQDNGFDVVEETKVYDVISSKTSLLNQARASGSPREKFVQKTKSLSHSNIGEVLTYTLDATFEYTLSGDVECHRYYSSYNIIQSDWVQSYEETSMKQTYNPNIAARPMTIKTKYKFVIKKGSSSKTNYTPSSSVWCDNRGNSGGN